MDLKPDKYYARIVIDTNDNGVWDTGNYAEKRQPEEVYYSPKMYAVSYTHLSVDQYTVGFADIQQTELLFTQHGTVRLDEIVKLHFFRILGSNTIDVDLVVTNLDRVARHTDTPFDIILSFINRAIDHITEIRFIQQEDVYKRQ